MKILFLTFFISGCAFILPPTYKTGECLCKKNDGVNMLGFVWWDAHWEAICENNARFPLDDEAIERCQDEK